MVRSTTGLGCAGMSRTIVEMGDRYDLWYDAATVGRELQVTCWISHGPRSEDPTFQPRPGDVVVLGDDEEPPLTANVVSRDGDRLVVQVLIAEAAAVAAS